MTPPTARARPPRSTPLALALLGGLAALLGASRAWAGDELPPTSQFFDEFDTNADGKVTPDEFRGAREEFRLIDKDGDGIITPTELGLPADYKPVRKAKPRRAGGEAPARKGGAARSKQAEQLRKRIMAMDADKDGRVSQDEWTGPEQAFGRFDRNRDGFIDAQDARDRGARKGGDGKGRPKPDGAGKPGPDAAAAEARKRRVERHFAALDKNGDGKLTADEAPDPRLLKMADADADGAVTVEEFLGFVQKRGRGARPGGGPEGAEPRRRGLRLTAGMLRRWDRDDDGKVAPSEFPGQDEMFKRLDADADGFLTEADARALRARGKDEGASDRPATRRGGDVIDQQDRDGDGRLNRAEFQGPNSTWRLLDRNRDGWITKDELKPS